MKFIITAVFIALTGCASTMYCELHLHNEWLAAFALVYEASAFIPLVQAIKS